MNEKQTWIKYASYRTLTDDCILEFILNEYQKSAIRNNSPPSTRFLSVLMHKICKWSNIPQATKKSLKTKIDRKIFNIRIMDNQRPKLARTYHPIELVNLIQNQWKRPISADIKTSIVRKYSAAMAMICLVTGRRWIDITRIRWESLESYTTLLGLFYKFYIPASKANIRGDRVESITLRHVKSEKYVGAIEMLNQIRIWQGNPAKGFVFPCVHKAIKFTMDTTWKSWSSYRCSGHWIGINKNDCLGQIDGKVTIGSLQRLARKLGWPTVPTKHTFRRLATLLHKRQGFSRDQINEIMGWVPESNMAVRYTATQDSLLPTAPANVYANELEKDQPFKEYENIQFNL